MSKSKRLQHGTPPKTRKNVPKETLGCIRKISFAGISSVKAQLNLFVSTYNQAVEDFAKNRNNISIRGDFPWNLLVEISKLYYLHPSKKLSKPSNKLCTVAFDVGSKSTMLQAKKK